MAEHLVSCALIRDGEMHSRGFKEHWKIRAALGDADPYTKNPADEYGFLTSEGRFVDRREAMRIGAAVGQCSMMGRELLSSDVRWEVATNPPANVIHQGESRQVRRARERAQFKRLSQ